MSKGVLCDVTRCIGCRGCQVACKQWNELPGQATTNAGTRENPPKLNAYYYTKIHFTEAKSKAKASIGLRQAAMHALSASRLRPGLYRWSSGEAADGPVTYDNNKCIGCRYCQVACPFGIPSFEWDKSNALDKEVHFLRR